MRDSTVRLARPPLVPSSDFPKTRASMSFSLLHPIKPIGGRVQLFTGKRMAELVTIPISFLEAVIHYERPIIRIWNDRFSLVQGLFDAMSPWKPNIDDLELVSTGKTSDQGFTLKLPLIKSAFFIGPAWCKFTRDDADWGLAEETVAVVETGLAAVMQNTSMSMGTVKTAISLHIQPKTARFRDILGPFVPQRLASLESDPVRTMAAVAKWSTRKVTVDGSGVLANALFLKLERDFESKLTFASIADQLRRDEHELFTILGVEEDRS